MSHESFEQDMLAGYRAYTEPVEIEVGASTEAPASGLICLIIGDTSKNVSKAGGLAGGMTGMPTGMLGGISNKIGVSGVSMGGSRSA